MSEADKIGLMGEEMSEADKIGLMGEEMFFEFIKRNIDKRLFQDGDFSGAAHIRDIRKEQEWMDVADVDFILLDNSGKCQLHEVKTDTQCYTESGYTLNLFLEYISHIPAYNTGETKTNTIEGKQYTVRQGAGWLHKNDALSPDWYHFILPVNYFNADNAFMMHINQNELEEYQVFRTRVEGREERKTPYETDRLITSAPLGYCISIRRDVLLTMTTWDETTERMIYDPDYKKHVPKRCHLLPVERVLDKMTLPDDPEDGKIANAGRSYNYGACIQIHFVAECITGDTNEKKQVILDQKSLTFMPRRLFETYKEGGMAKSTIKRMISSKGRNGALLAGHITGLNYITSFPPVNVAAGHDQ